MKAAPALAALMGLDSTLVLVTLITSTAMIPISAPVFTYAFIGDGLTLSALALGLRLFAILAGSALVGIMVRGMAGPAAIERQADAIGGVNILILFVFVAAVMESVAVRFIAAPMITVGLAALAFLVYFAALGLTSLLFARAGRARVCPRAHGVAAQNGADARRDGRGLARPHLALFRPLPVPDLPLAAAASTTGAASGYGNSNRAQTKPVAGFAWWKIRWIELRLRRPIAGCLGRTANSAPNTILGCAWLA